MILTRLISLPPIKIYDTILQVGIGENMSSLRTCKTCGVPLKFGRDHSWNGDGTITQRRDPTHRMILFDSEGLDTLFDNIESIIGMPLEKIIIESKARATRDYIARQIVGMRGTIVRIVGIDRIVRMVVEQGRLLGYGDIIVHEFDWKGGTMQCEIGNPYSLPLFCGDLLGSNEAIRKLPGACSYEKIGLDRYMINTVAAEHAPEFADRLLTKMPPRKPGNVEHDLCPGCKAPREVSRYKWDLEAGTIKNSETGMRLALFGPVGLQVMFEELESELGDTIPDTIVEAQRQIVSRKLNLDWNLNDPDVMSKWLSVQGMGNLVEMTAGEEGILIRIENAAVPLVLVGNALGIFEAYANVKGVARWEISPDGDLTIRLAAV
jgi:hypothetical protein